jgi:hypothetical protein
VIPAQLVAEVEDLRAEGRTVELAEEGDWAIAVFPAYPVVFGYSSSRTDLVLRIPRSYPNGSPDMFWTDEGLTLKGGALPKNADHVESILGIRRRRFSWHPQAWNPGRDSLRTYLEFVNNRLAKSL